MIKDEAQKQQSSGDMLALKHVGLIVSFVISTVLSYTMVFKLFTLWTGKTNGVGGIIANLYFMPVTVGHVNAIWLALGAMMFAGLALWLSAQVRRGLMARPDFSNRLIYKVPLHAGLGVLGLYTLWLVLMVITTLFSALIFIGSYSSILSLIIDMLLPSLASLILFATASLFLFRMVKGLGGAKTLSIILLSVAGVVFLTTTLTVATLSHAYRTQNDYGNNPKATKRVPAAQQYNYSR